MDHETFLLLNSTAWIAITGILQIILVIVWILVTRSYVRSSKRQADATEEQVVVGKAQIDAAKSQAQAAMSQAQAAREQLYFQKELAENVRVVSRRLIAAAIQRGLSEIEYWKRIDLNLYLNAKTFPNLDLVPNNEQEVIEAAAHFSSEVSSGIALAFDQMRLAQRELAALRDSKLFVSPITNQLLTSANHYLESAFIEMDAARLKLATNKL